MTSQCLINAHAFPLRKSLDVLRNYSGKLLRKVIKRRLENLKLTFLKWRQTGYRAVCGGRGFLERCSPASASRMKLCLTAMSTLPVLSWARLLFCAGWTAVSPLKRTKWRNYYISVGEVLWLASSRVFIKYTSLPRQTTQTFTSVKIEKDEDARDALSRLQLSTSKKLASYRLGKFPRGKFAPGVWRRSDDWDSIYVITSWWHRDWNLRREGSWGWVTYAGRLTRFHPSLKSSRKVSITSPGRQNLYAASFAMTYSEGCWEWCRRDQRVVCFLIKNRPMTKLVRTGATGGPPWKKTFLFKYYTTSIDVLVLL